MGRRLLLTCLLLAGCGGAPAHTENVAEVEAEEPPSSPPVTQGTIQREELDAILELGLGRFLQHVTTEPHLEGGRFVGHRLTELRSPLFEGVDLRPGDTLVRVNGMPVERPEEAMAVWSGLRVASELTLDLLRDGEPHQLRFQIAQ